MTRAVTWPAGRPLTRAHSHEFGSTEFDGRTTADARFSPLSIDGMLSPVLYAGDSDRTAAAETILRNLPPRPGPRRVAVTRFRSWQWSEIRSTRDLQLIAVDRSLAGGAVLVDGDAADYPASRAAAGALLAAETGADGLIWCSRQLLDTPSQDDVEDADAAVCVLLAARADGTGVARADLDALGPAVPFWLPEGLGRLDSVAVDLDVTVVRP